MFKLLMITGVDEAGRGPAIGPLVVAGVTIDDNSKLVKNKIKDSKKLSPRRRQYLSAKIIKMAVNYELLVIPAKDIDDMRKVMTLNDIEVNAFSKVIKKLNPEICYVDSADVDEERFKQNILNNLTRKPDIISKHKADDIYPVVSAASILAKIKRDEIIKDISFKLERKVGIPMGSGYPADPITVRFLRKWINTFGSFPPEIRHSWKTIKNLENEKINKKLEDF